MKMLLALSVASISLLLNANDNSIVLKKVNELYESRHSDRTNLKKALDLLDALDAAGVKDQQVYIEISRLCFFYGDEKEVKEERIQIFDKGIKYGQLAISMNEKSDNAHFWYLANMGRTIQLKGIMNGLVAAREVKKEIKKTLVLNPRHVGALSASCSFYAQVPGIFGGSIEKAEQQALEAISIEPRYTFLYLDAARVYIQMGKYDLAREYLAKMNAIKEPYSRADYEVIDRPTGKKLIKQIDELTKTAEKQ